MPNPLKIPYGPADIDPSGLPDISNRNWEAKAPAIKRDPNSVWGNTPKFTFGIKIVSKLSKDRYLRSFYIFIKNNFNGLTQHL